MKAAAAALCLVRVLFAVNACFAVAQSVASRRRIVSLVAAPWFERFTG